MSRDERRKELDEMPGHLIRRLQQIAFAIFMDQAQTFGVTPVQYAAIFAINDHPGIDQTALCNVIAYDRSTIGDVVTRLEKKKFIRRRHGPLDRRTRALYVTPLGCRLLRDIAPAVAAAQRLIVAPLQAGERHFFMRMLKELVHLNNEHSRAPLRPKDARQQRPRLAVRRARAGRKPRSSHRPRPRKSSFAD
jgi:MarR family transcriptional regulator, lower aerobic nicotinate degradation pathway regulator